MEQHDGNSLLKVITEGLAYFLSGIFVINVIAPLLLSQNQGNLVDRLANWVTIVVGAFSVLVGFLFVSVVIPCKRVPGFLRYFHQHKDWLVMILFPITLPQIFRDLHNRPVFILAVIFLIFILVAMVTKTWSIIAKNTRYYTRYLVTLSLAFCVSAIIRLFQGASKIEVAVLLVATCILLILALRGKKERQLRLFRR
jgi:hypothetical protein